MVYLSFPLHDSPCTYHIVVFTVREPRDPKLLFNNASSNYGILRTEGTWLQLWLQSSE